jgi:hypothetical protein
MDKINFKVLTKVKELLDLKKPPIILKMEENIISLTEANHFKTIKKAENCSLKTTDNFINHKNKIKMSL